MRSPDPCHLNSTSPVKKKRWLFFLWHRSQNILKKLLYTIQKWLGLRSFQSSAFDTKKALEFDLSSVPWTARSDQSNPVPLPIDFLKGIDRFPEFSYWSNQDLRNSIWDVYTPIQPRQSVVPNSVINAASGLSLSELSRGFQEDEVEETKALRLPLQPNPLETWNGLQMIPNWTNLSAGKLLETIDWERSTRKVQTASKDDLSLLGDLLAGLPE